MPQILVEAVHDLERELKMPVWLVTHDMIARKGMGFAVFGNWHSDQFFRQRAALPRNKPVAVLLHSPGGYANCAYQIARLLHRHCGEFSVVVPRWAKSAATLFTLGASKVYLGSYAELGPLDAQYEDPDKEERTSALDEVHSLQRLHAAALSALDETVLMLELRTKKKYGSLLPHATQFASDFMRPLLEKVDPVHYTQRSRDLKVAEEYAIRLLRKNYDEDAAKTIAHALVEEYPDHVFVIDNEEAGSIGFRTERPPQAIQQLLDVFVENLNDRILIGRLVEA